MNTAVISALDADGNLIRKQRQLDEHDRIWSAVVVFLDEKDCACVRVQRYNDSDVLIQQYCVEIEAV